MDQGPGARGQGSGWRDLLPPWGTLLAFYAIAGRHPPLGSSTRYYLSAREMAAAGGDWIFPHLHGVAYFEKPPLAYWVGAVGQRLFGDGPLALHLPALLGCLLLVGAARWAGNALSPATGRAAAWLTAGSGMVLALSTVYLTDQLFAGLLALAWCAFAAHDRAGGMPHAGMPECRNNAGKAPAKDANGDIPAFQHSSAQHWRWLFWILLGLAWLTKGPLALVLSGCAVGGYLLLKGGPGCVWREGWRLAPFRGLLVLLAVILPWHLAVWLRDPRGLEMFYVTINLRGFFDPTINHPASAWFYLPVLLAGWTPWILTLAPLLVLGLWEPLRAAPARIRAWWDWPIAEDREHLRLVALVVFPLAFLSVSSSKLAYYILPSWPALAALLADRLLPRLATPPAWLRRALAVQVGLLALGAVGFAIVRGGHGLPKRIDWSHGEVVALAAALLLAGMAWGAVACWRGRMRHGLIAAGIGQALAAALLLACSGELTDAREAAPLASAQARRIAPADRVILGPGAAHEHGVPWVLRRDCDVLCPPRELGMGLFCAATPPSTALPRDPYRITPADVPAQIRLLDLDGLRRAWDGQQRIWLFAELGEPRELPAPAWVVGRNGGFWLLTNQPITGATAWRR